MGIPAGWRRRTRAPQQAYGLFGKVQTDLLEALLKKKMHGAAKTFHNPRSAHNKARMGVYVPDRSRACIFMIDVIKIEPSDSIR